MNFIFFRVLIVIICLNFIETFSQSSDLLIQQYRKHNFDIEYYKKNIKNNQYVIKQIKEDIDENKKKYYYFFLRSW